MNSKVMELAGQAEIVKGAVADRAIAVIEQYRNGKHHGREVSMILAELFEAANDTVERMVVDAALKANKQITTKEVDAARDALRFIVNCLTAPDGYGRSCIIRGFDISEVKMLRAAAGM